MRLVSKSASPYFIPFQVQRWYTPGKTGFSLTVCSGCKASGAAAPVFSFSRCALGLVNVRNRFRTARTEPAACCNLLLDCTSFKSAPQITQKLCLVMTCSPQFGHFTARTSFLLLNHRVRDTFSVPQQQTKVNRLSLILAIILIIVYPFCAVFTKMPRNRSFSPRSMV